MPIKKLLIANRGEIALRIIRSAKEMGIKTVAVYSQADRHALHVRAADQAVCIGPPPSAQSYLLMDKIIEACLATGADAVHPGYGFLSENAVFAKKARQAGIIFVGPSEHSIEIMGSKLAAKQAVAAANIPLVPGTHQAIDDVEQAKVIAEKIGYPVLIKASAGGGGKGMRLVEQPDQLAEQMQRAISEAQSAFGDGAVFIEKFIVSPKHIEIQVLGDQLGNVVHLFERECSIQRRHQKVIEEAPSPVLTPEIRKAMGACAVEVAKACNYFGAGTVEFVVDKDLNFFFLEMNTRLQVEHPVTEAITGIDLVKEQIRIAQGEKLTFAQENLKINGHAIEVRLYAEDPTNNFLPDIGRLEVYQRPQGPGIRVDDGFEQGMDIPIYYDPMIAKLIVHAPNRTEAIAKMLQAIEAYQIVGISHTLPFCSFVLKHPEFVNGKFTTKFVEQFFTPDVLQNMGKDPDEMRIAAFLAATFFEKNQKKLPTNSQIINHNRSDWKSRKRN